MAEAAALTVEQHVTPVLPEVRGATTLSDAVGEKIARVAALSVAGVQQHSRTLSSITGVDYPKISVDMSAERPAVTAEVAIGWGYPTAEVLAQVRDAIGVALIDYTGVSPARVDVELVRVVSATRPAELADRTASTGSAKGRAPTAVPRAVLLTSVLACGLLGLAAVAAHDLVVRWGWARDTFWMTTAFEWVGNLHWQSWMLPAAIACLVVGAWAAWISVEPRRKTHATLDGDGQIYLRHRDLARHLSATARRVDGVTTATTVITRRRVQVTITPVSPQVSSEQIATTVRQNVEAELRAHPSLGDRKATVKVRQKKAARS